MLNAPMDHGWPATSAVDVPRARVELELAGKRRHRGITGVSGVVLFLCLFLPAVDGCSEAVYPITMPMFWHPYLYGLVFAFASASIAVRHVRYAVVALRVLAWLTIIGATVLIMFAGPVGLAELIIGAVCLGAIGQRGFSERRAAISAIIVGTLSLLWFGLWLATPDALIGVYVSAAASTGVLAGGLLWLGEVQVRI